MKNKVAPLLMVVLPFLGLFDAGYVTYETLSGKIPICLPPFQCAVFLEDSWAYIAGLPLSAYGVIFFTTFLILAIMNFLDIKDTEKWLRGLATFGLMFAAYVTIVMAFVVKAWCIWCLVSAINLSITFAISRFLKLGVESKPSKEEQI